MRAITFLAFLVALALITGCIYKSSELKQAPSTPTSTVSPMSEEIPTVSDITEADLPQEPNLELEDTVDLGEIL